MTLAEYQATPEVVTPQELIFGAIVAKDAPSVPHQRVVFAMARALHSHCARHGGEVLIAPTDVVLDREQALALQPDLLYLAPTSTALVGDRVIGAPDLVVEVLSPNPRVGRLDDKVRWYAHYGVREIWLYHQFSRQLDVLNTVNGAVRSVRRHFHAQAIESAVLPNLDLRVGEIAGGGTATF